MATTPPLFQGERLTRFRFDLLPWRAQGQTIIAVLLTAETSSNEAFAWAIGKPLAVKLYQDMRRAAAELGHVIDERDPATASFLGANLLGLMPEVWRPGVDLAPQTIVLEVWDTVYILDVSGPDGVAHRISLGPSMAVVFSQQLGDALETISSAA